MDRQVNSICMHYNGTKSASEYSVGIKVKIKGGRCREWKSPLNSMSHTNFGGHLLLILHQQKKTKNAKSAKIQKVNKTQNTE